MSAGAVSIPWHRPDVARAVLDVAESIATAAVADALAKVETDVEEAFWAGVEFQRRYEDHARGLAAWAVSTPTRDELARRRGAAA